MVIEANKSCSTQIVPLNQCVTSKQYCCYARYL